MQQKLTDTERMMQFSKILNWARHLRKSIDGQGGRDRGGGISKGTEAGNSMAHLATSMFWFHRSTGIELGSDGKHS